MPQVAQLVGGGDRVRIPPQFILYLSPKPIPTGHLPSAPILEAELTHPLHIRLAPGLTAPQPQATSEVTSRGCSQSCDRETRKGWAQGEQGQALGCSLPTPPARVSSVLAEASQRDEVDIFLHSLPWAACLSQEGALGGAGVA